jgi:putative DNA primase/helicase
MIVVLALFFSQQVHPINLSQQVHPMNPNQQVHLVKENQQPSDESPTAETPNGDTAPQLPPVQPQPAQHPEPPAQREDDVIHNLAGMNRMDYDRQRKDAAKRLGVQVKTLDERVEASRRPKEEAGAANALFPTVEPWPEPLVPAELLDEVAEAIKRFLVLSPEEVTACSLWVVHTYLVNAFEHSPLLLVNAPERACGKTLCQQVLARISFRPLPAANASLSVLFRSIEKWQPTLFLDEADTFFRDNRDLHGVVNAGYKRGGCVLRTEAIDESFYPRPFNVYCAKSIAGIALERHLPEATMSRGLVLNLRRKLPHERVERLRHADHRVFEVLKSKLVRFAADHEAQLAKADPVLPSDLSDRDQDNWAPLLAIAECAGPEWLTRATAAALKLSEDGGSAETIGSQLLADIEEIFATEREMKFGQAKVKVTKLSSVDLTAALADLDEAPWRTWNRGKPLTPRQLAKLLSPYGITSKTVRRGAHDTPKGYDLAQFQDALNRYRRPASLALPPRRNISPELMAGKESDVADTASEIRHTIPEPPQRNVAATPKSLPGMESGGVAAVSGVGHGESGDVLPVADLEPEDVGNEPAIGNADEDEDDLWGIGFGIAAAEGDSLDDEIPF